MGELLPFRRSDVVSAAVEPDGPPAAPPRSRPDRPLQPRSRQPEARQSGPRPPEPLWRVAAGEVLREQRHRQEQTLADVAGRAGISVQYLSEVERGRKEPSSEVLAAVTGALQLSLVDLTRLVLRRLTPLDLSSRPSGPLDRPGGPVALAA